MAGTRWSEGEAKRHNEEGHEQRANLEAACEL